MTEVSSTLPDDIGKGLSARYFAFELTTPGQDFDLDSVEFIPMMRDRRV